ncbi:hypothetical protein ACQR1H_03120 [Bradyrhizobium sp. HKCCYLRH2015]|uniref:hypothetical protein n=1 Tax=Bradyrhizobium sp. HKCCYLRH2015 TaxID=3420742 RepID=UPI003EBBB7F3
MKAKLFEPVSVENRRGYRISCSCGAVARVPMNTVRCSNGRDSDFERRLVERKFEKLGWQIGEKASEHVCPTCARARAAERLSAMIGRARGRGLG